MVRFRKPKVARKAKVHGKREKTSFQFSKVLRYETFSAKPFILKTIAVEGVSVVMEYKNAASPR